MQDRNLIYSISFPTPASVAADIEENTTTPNGIKRKAAEDFFNQLEKNIRFIPNKEKESEKEVFIAAVKSFATAHQIDTDIYLKEWGYTADLKVRLLIMCEEYMKELFLKLLILADSIQIIRAENSQEYCFTISLDYHTHDRYYKGQKLS